MFPMEVDKFIENTNQPLGRTYSPRRCYRDMEPLPPVKSNRLPKLYNAFGFLWPWPNYLPKKAPPIICDHCGVVHLLEPNRDNKLPLECPFCGEVGGQEK